MPPPTQPSIRETAFSCPHCSVFTNQFWYEVLVDRLRDKEPLPYLPGEQERKSLERDEISKEHKQPMLECMDKIQTGLIFLGSEKSRYVSRAHNIHFEQCYDCKKIAVWVHDRLLFPAIKSGVLPNPDLPDDALRDFQEAREIVNSSRGAAALLRLCVQKLCKHLGEQGKNLDDDIASLVKKRLDPLVQKSLDIVRVIGNEAVHPGVLDLRDDRDTALRLFELINSIADQMISHPKNVTDLYEKLPENKRKRIEERDGKTPKP